MIDIIVIAGKCWSEMALQKWEDENTDMPLQYMIDLAFVLL